MCETRRVCLYKFDVCVRLGLFVKKLVQQVVHLRFKNFDYQHHTCVHILTCET